MGLSVRLDQTHPSDTICLTMFDEAFGEMDAASAIRLFHLSLLIPSFFAWSVYSVVSPWRDCHKKPSNTNGGCDCGSYL